MNLNSAQQKQMEMVLKQSGARIESIHGLLSYVKIDLGGTEISYVFNINRKKQFFLQRVTPYPVGAGTFDNALDVLKYIRQDIELFKTAVENRNQVFNKFTEVAYRTHRIIHAVEDVFLTFDVSMDHMEKIESYLDAIEGEIKAIEKSCQRINIREKFNE